MEILRSSLPVLRWLKYIMQMVSYTKYIDTANDVNPLYRAQNYAREITNNSYRVNIFLELKPFKGI